MRRYQRIATPKGLWVAWQYGKLKQVSRVRDLNIGGLFVATDVPPENGTVLEILLTVPEGEIRGHAVVRNVLPAEGMGIEFKDFSAADSDRLEKLVTRLLKTNSADPD